MRTAARVAILSLALALASHAAGPSAQAPRLSVLNASPNGEVAALADANEIRVTFSEPMIAIGAPPAPASVPWFSIAPAAKGAFYWSGHADADLHAGSVGAAAICDPIHRPHRRCRPGGERPDAGNALRVHVHDADRASALGRVVSQERTRVGSGGRRAPLQPAGAAAGCAGAHGAPGIAASVDAAAHAGRSAAMARAARCGRPRALEREGRARRGRGLVTRGVPRAHRHRVER